MSNLNPRVEDLRVAPVAVDPAPYIPSPKETEVVARVMKLWITARNEKSFRFEYLDNRNIIEYINDSVKRFITNIDARDDIEDWQARIHDPFTRNKVLAILGKIVDALPTVEFFPRGNEDILKAEILNTLFEYSEEVDNSEEFMTFAVQEALVKGTCVGYEGYTEFERDVNNITSYDEGDGITMTKDKKIVRKVTSQIVPLEEFYPSNVGIRNIQDMPYCFWRKIIPFHKFLQDYSNYEKAKVVWPYATPTFNQENRPFYWDYISAEVLNGHVEVMKYYAKNTDEFVIIANGIWLNPLPNEEVAPLPFNHKRLPFWSFIYDILGADFFYGKSLPDKLKSLQDVLNVLHNMLLDQSFLTIFPPLLVAGVDDIEDDFLRPGRRIVVDTQGVPLNQAYMKLDVGTPGGWHEFILNYTKNILEESSVDQVNQGVAGVGGRTTATEIRNAAAGVVSLLGLFAKFIKYGLKERARLRAANILQFYTDPKNPVIEQVMGVGGTDQFNKAFNIFEVDSSPLTPGSRGTKIVEVYADKSHLPTKQELQTQTRLDEITTGKKIKRIAIIPSYIRDFEFDLRLVPNPKSEFSQEVEKAQEVQFQQIVMALYPDLIDRKELAAELISKFNRDPSKILDENALAAVLAPPGEPGLPQSAQGQNAANMTAGPGGTSPQGATIAGSPTSGPFAPQNRAFSRFQSEGFLNSLRGK